VNWLEFSNLAGAVALSMALNSIWLAMLTAALATLVVRLLPRPNATTRYTLWFTALLLAVVTPVVIPLIPRPVSPLSDRVMPGGWAFAVPVTSAWPMYLALAWMAITALLLARVVWSLLHIRGLKHRATVIGERGRVRVLVSEDERVPMAAGFFDRAIIFPRGLLAELSSTEFEQVVCHELAHLRRWDDWTQLIQAIGQALLFFNPAVYWIGRRLTIEREMACDDWVVAGTGEARPYAACLTHLHELTRHSPEPPVRVPQLAPGATTRRRWQLTSRVEALLEPRRNWTPRFSRSGWMAACTMVGAAALVATYTAPLVGVQELPLATLALAHPRAPLAPPFSRTPLRAIAAPVRPRLLASRVHQPARVPAMISPAAESYLLVRAWQIRVTPTYFVITVVWLEPPPPSRLNAI
jgi:hypothetical protein